MIPAPADPADEGPDRAARERMWAEVLRRLEEQPSRRCRRWPGRGRSTLLAAGCGALVVAALLAVGPPGPAGSAAPPGRQTATAPPPGGALEALQAAAATTAQLHLDATHPHLWLVTEARPAPGQRDVPGWTVGQWLRADGSGWSRLGGPGADEQQLGPPVAHAAGTLGVAGLVPAEVETLPADPWALLDRLRAASRADRSDASLPERIAALLALPLLAPGARAGLLELLEDLGGTVAGPASGAETPAVRVVVPAAGGGRVEVVLDPATARTLSLVAAPVDGGVDPLVITYRRAGRAPA